MRPGLLKVCILSSLVCSLNIAYAASVKKSDLMIENIQVGAMDQDTSPSQFSVLISLKNQGRTLDNWQLGFYMPYSFYSLASERLNPNLQMQICDYKGQCSNLRYVNSKNISDNDLSQGGFTILAPLVKYPLKKGEKYLITLAHNNQGLPLNISSLPQSLFIMDPNSDEQVPEIFSINTELTDYTILNYDHNNVEKDIEKHLTQNWQQSQPGTNESDFNLVPSPTSLVVSGDGTSFSFGDKLIIHNQLNSDNAVANYWKSLIATDLKLRPKKVLVDNDPNAETGIIITNISNPKVINNNPEGYRLTISSNSVTIEAMTSAGVYYAFQTLRQLWYNNNKQLPAVTIVDYPRFRYRGVLLDTARHFFSLTEVNKLIDVMAAHKLNTLHLHLTDDEAFRLSLDNYPQLATGQVRGLGQLLGPAVLLQNNLDTTNLSQQNYPLANTPYQGSYSTADIRAIVAYANQNQITVIPEVDIPGHTRALVKSYPDILIDPNDNSQYASVQGFTNNVLPICTYNSNVSIGNQFTNLINGVIQDTVKLFDGQTTIYAQAKEISVGGDEVSKNAWSNDTSCNGEWSTLTALEKSHLFFSKLAKTNDDILFSGWQQFIQNDDSSLSKNIVPTNQTGHIWVWNPSKTGIKDAIILANNDYPTVLEFADKTYFDLAYTPSMYEPGFTWAGSYLDTNKVLSIVEAADKTISQTKKPQNILGIEGALWSENLPSSDHLFYMALSKMSGLAEAGWSQSSATYYSQKLNWQSLAKRLGCGKTGFLSYLSNVYQVNYRGYPNGIKEELPQDNFCNESSTQNNFDK